MKINSTCYFTVAGISLCTLPLLSQQSIIKKPNIIVIMSDDIGYSDIGCFGSEIKTPNIDRLASNGMRFTQFYNTARCSPSRAALLTGLYPHQAGMGHLSTENYKEPGYVDDLGKNTVTIAEVLKKAGYSTYMTGKWHIAKDMTETGDRSNWPLQRGFDRYFGTLNGSGSYFDPGTLISNNTFVGPGKNFYYTDAISDTTVKFIRQHHKGKPFFFYVAYTSAHWPLHAPEKEIEKYKGVYDKGWDAVREQRFENLKKLSVIDKNCVLTERGVDIPAWKDEPMKEWQSRRMEVYAAMISIMDQGIGRIVKALEEKGELENTVIFYMQDNGGCAEPQGSNIPTIPLTAEQKILKPISYDAISVEKRTVYTRDGHFVRSGKGVMAGPADTWMAYGEEWANVSNTPYREYKQWVHEGGIASPLVVSWPAVIKTKGSLSRQLSHLIDIMPTCLEIAGVTYPKEYNSNIVIPVEGISLVPAFKNQDISREFMFWEHSANRAIRMADWKLVAKVKSQKKFIPADQNSWELYDLKTDPSETRNLESKYPDKVKLMADKWEKEALRLMAKPWPWDQIAIPVPESLKSLELKAQIFLTTEIITRADNVMIEKPVTITSSFCKRSAGGIHDFYSEGDYWWPDPANPDGPYIQRDGMTNPDNFTDHRKAMIRLSRIVGALSSAYKVTGDEKYVKQAFVHLGAWFVDSSSRMNPSLLYSQAIKGRFTGRGIGIIDTIQLMEVAQGIIAMQDAKCIDKALLDSIKLWFSEYLKWLTTHQYGKDEMNAKNNHGTCWVMQVASFASLTGNEEILDFCRKRYMEVLLPDQMGTDGSFPLEIKRTKPYGYSLFNLDAMTMVCLILSDKKNDLWNYTTPDGKSIQKGMQFLYPYVADKSKWPNNKDVMYWDEWPVAHPFLIFGAIKFNNSNWYNTWASLEHFPEVEEVIRNLPVRNPIIWFK